MRINMDLSVPPENPREAANYAELYADLQRIHAAISGRKLSQEEFSD